jgi:hypothetical protein
MNNRNLKTKTRRFAAGVFMALAVIAVSAFAAPGAVEAGSVNASQTLQFAEASSAAAQCKANCVRSFDSCVAGGCVGGSGEGGACTHAEAVSGCTEKHGARKDKCLAGCDQ